MGGDKRHQELASQCSTTLVTESDHRFHSFSGEFLYPNSFWQIRRDCGLRLPEARYDLISVPTFHGLKSDAARMQKLIENICLAVDVHSTERVCVFGYDNAESICEHLYRELQPRFPNLSFAGRSIRKFSNSPADEPSRRLVVTCMDFRLHHEDGLQGEIVGPTAWLTYPGAAFAGTDKETEEIFFADLDRVLDREAVDELTLISHTDCAMYASKYSWQSAKEEKRQLEQDLLTVAERISLRYSHLTVLCGIAVVREGGVKELIPIS